MEQASRYGPPIERHPDGTLYQMSPSQQKQAAKLIKKHCCKRNGADVRRKADAAECSFS